MVLWDISPSSSQSTDSPNSHFIIPCPKNSFLNVLACCEVRSTTFDSITGKRMKNTFHFHHENHKSKASLVNVLARNLCPWWPKESLIPQISKKCVLAGPTTQVDSRRQGQQATQIWFLGAKKMKGAAPLVVCSAHKWLRLDHCHSPAYHKAQHPSPWRNGTLVAEVLRVFT